MISNATVNPQDCCLYSWIVEFNVGFVIVFFLTNINGIKLETLKLKKIPIIQNSWELWRLQWLCQKFSFS